LNFELAFNNGKSGVISVDRVRLGLDQGSQVQPTCIDMCMEQFFYSA